MEVSLLDEKVEGYRGLSPHGLEDSGTPVGARSPMERLEGKGI
jgi:hypothetical protein